MNRLFAVFAIAAFLLSACAPETPAVAPTPTLTKQPPNPTSQIISTGLPSPILTSPTPTAPACLEDAGTLERIAVDSATLSRSLWVSVYLPPCINAASSKEYPVLYLLHGQSTDDRSWQALGLAETADALIRSGRIVPMLIIMPQEEYYLQDTRESAYGQALVQDLLPWVDQHYPTCSLRQCRAVGGISRGGGWAIHLAFNAWQQFGAAAGHSLPPFVNDGINLPYRLREIAPGQTPAIYIDIGVLDPYLKPAIQYEALLTQYRVPHEWHLNAGTHDEAYWRAHLEEYLLWYGSIFNQTGLPQPD